MHFSLYIFFALLGLVAVASADPWNAANNPSKMDIKRQYQYALTQLAASGTKRGALPWSDTYWPNFNGGIANRWNARPAMTFSYRLHTLDELQQMTPRQLSQLSPAEKFDIMQARYDYPTVLSEWKRTSPSDQGWEGLCHGWAPAALAYRQPRPVTLANLDGLRIPFGSSDIKALLTYFVGVYAFERTTVQLVGSRCNFDLNAGNSFVDLPACADINAGALHVILANELGRQRRGFLIDRFRGDEIWNQPVYTFNSTVIQRRVDAKVCWVDEAPPRWEAYNPVTDCATYSYSLDLGPTGNVTGGNWLSQDRPDFAFHLKPPAFFGYFAALKDIYEASTAASRRKRGVGDQDGDGDVDDSDLLQVVNVTECTRHTLLSNLTGEFGLDVATFPAGTTFCWTIAPEVPGVDLIRIAFEQFKTDRHRMVVKVYEGLAVDGPLVAVHHGNDLPPVLEVDADAAYVVLTSDLTGCANVVGGFKATYHAILRDDGEDVLTQEL